MPPTSVVRPTPRRGKATVSARAVIATAPTALIGDLPIPDSFSGGGSSASVFLGFALPKRSRGLFVVLCVTESRDSRRRRRQRLIIVAIVVFAMLAATLAGLVAAFADSSAHPGRACSGTVGSMRATGGDPQSDPACAQTGTGPL